jgi:hypothetical protein
MMKIRMKAHTADSVMVKRVLLGGQVETVLCLRSNANMDVAAAAALQLRQLPGLCVLF